MAKGLAMRKAKSVEGERHHQGDAIAATGRRRLSGEGVQMEHVPCATRADFTMLN